MSEKTIRKQIRTLYLMTTVGYFQIAAASWVALLALRGFNSFSRKVWLAVVDDKVPNTVLFMLDSPDGDEGYPGNMKAFVRYTFDDENVLTIKWSAVSDKDTICNLTNHSYFNLNGHKSGKVTENHKLKINANSFIPINSNLNPTGEITPVKNTSFDFTEPKLIGNGIDRKNKQIGFANGIDHMFVLNHSDEEFVLAAEAEGIDSGITLKCYTSQKGVHVYTANYVDVLSNMGKDSATYGENSAFCLETQGFPDAVNHKTFPTTILKANENYTQNENSVMHTLEARSLDDIVTATDILADFIIKKP